MNLQKRTETSIVVCFSSYTYQSIEFYIPFQNIICFIPFTAIKKHVQWIKETPSISWSIRKILEGLSFDQKFNFVIIYREPSKTYRNVHSGLFFTIYIPIDRVLYSLSAYYMFYTIYCYQEVCVLDQIHDVFGGELKNCVCRAFRKNVHNFSN